MADEFSDLVHENFSLKRKLEDALRVVDMLRKQKPMLCRDCAYVRVSDQMLVYCGRCSDVGRRPLLVDPDRDYCSQARRRKA